MYIAMARLGNVYKLGSIQENSLAAHWYDEMFVV